MRTRWGALWERTKLFFIYAIAQIRVVRDIYPGIMHLCIFWGFLIQGIGTAIGLTQHDMFIPFLFLPFPRGGAYLAYELLMDIGGVLAVVGLFMAVFRRYVLRPKRLDNSWDDAYTLSILLAIPLSGFFLESLRMVAAGPPWGAWSPIGNNLGRFWMSLGMTPEVARSWHNATYWAHALLFCVALVSLPFTKMSHLLTGPLSIIFKPFRPEGALVPIEKLEEQETFGVGKIGEFVPKQLLEFDACMRCGRCQDACPANFSGMPLSPKRLIQELKGYMVKEWLAGRRDGDLNGLIGAAVSEEELWACTTCRACMEECPVLIEHVNTIVDMRRYLVLSEGKLPPSVAASLRNTTNTGNPWAMPTADRAAWAEGLGIKRMSEVGEAEVLYWVGCAGSYDARNQKVARAMARVLNKAGVNFAVLGEEERCTGEWARRVGEEYLFQTLAVENIVTLKKYRFKRVLAHCPHCFNTLKNEYPQFGGQFEVVHHTEFLAQLLKEGRLVPSKALKETITYHDSCYLGRYNKIYNEPRELLASIPGVKLVEMRRARERGFCCGGGGGGMWMEISPEVRINRRRLEDALKVNPQIIGTACPYCLIMFDEVVKAKGLESLLVKDIVELIEEAT